MKLPELLRFLCWHEWEYRNTRGTYKELTIDTLSRYCPRCTKYECVGYSVWAILKEKPRAKWIEGDSLPASFLEHLLDVWNKS